MRLLPIAFLVRLEKSALIHTGRADAAIGLQAAALQQGLSFLPLFEERYDLVLPRENEKPLLPLLEYLQTADFRNSLLSLTGYNTAHSGEQILLKFLAHTTPVGRVSQGRSGEFCAESYSQ